MDLPFDLDNPPYTLVKSKAEFIASCEKLSSERMIGIDTETTGFDPYLEKLLIIQMGTAEHVYITPFEFIDSQALQIICSKSDTIKILQNAKFDYQFIKAKLGVTVTGIFDTFLAERLITCGLSRENSLKAIASKYLGLAMDKSIRETFVGSKSLNKEQLKYAAIDVLVLPIIAMKQIELLKKHNMVEIAKLEFQTVEAVAEMELNGIHIDQSQWRANLDEHIIKKAESEEAIQAELMKYFEYAQGALFSDSPQVINLSSPSQVLKMFHDLGFKIEGTGESILKTIDHPVAKRMIEFRENEKVLSSFGENLLAKINPITKRIHPNFMQIGADTGRFSCTNPNLQNIPASSSFRSCFCAPEGKKLVVSDYSQQELRVLAQLTSDPNLRKAYEDDLDLHTFTAHMMFNVPLDSVEKSMRKAAKIINFGIIYGMGPGLLATNLEVPLEESKRLLTLYLNTYKGVRDWTEAASRTASTKGYSTTISGRRRWYIIPDKTDPEYNQKIGSIGRQGKNSPIQGSSADMTKYALCYINSSLSKANLNAKLLLTVHDEIVVEADETIAEEVKVIVKSDMERAGKFLLPDVPVKADAMISQVWEH